MDMGKRDREGNRDTMASGSIWFGLGKNNLGFDGRVVARKLHLHETGEGRRTEVKDLA